MNTQKSERERIIEISDIAYSESKKLRAKNPKHELLRLMDTPEEDAIWNEFQNRFGRKDIECAQEYFWGQYYLALQDAIGIGDNVCFIEETIENDKNSDAYINGAAICDNEDHDDVLIFIVQRFIRKEV